MKFLFQSENLQLLVIVIFFCLTDLSKTSVSTMFSHHVVLVLQEDGELLEEGDGHQQQLLVVPLQDLHQRVDDVFVPHLQLGARVFSQVQQQTQSHCRAHRAESLWGNGSVLLPLIQT